MNKQLFGGATEKQQVALTKVRPYNLNSKLQLAQEGGAGGGLHRGKKIKQTQSAISVSGFHTKLCQGL